MDAAKFEFRKRLALLENLVGALKDVALILAAHQPEGIADEIIRLINVAEEAPQGGNDGQR